MVVSFLKHRWQKIVLWVIAVLAILVVAVALFLDSFLTGKLSVKLKEAVLKGTDSLYHVNFSNAELHVFSGTVVLYNISYMPDTAVYHQLQKDDKAPNSLYELRVKRLEVSGVHALDIWLKKEMEVDLVSLKDPEIYISRYGNKPHKSAPKDKRTLYQKISKSFKFVHVKDIRLDGISFTYRNKSTSKPTVSVLKQMDVQANDLLIDSATQADTSRTLYCRDIVTQLMNYTGKSAGGLYTYKIRSIKLSTKTERLTVTGVDIMPLNAATYFEKSQDDRFTLHFDDIIADHFDYRTFRRRQGINAAKITLGKGFFNIFTNPHGKLKTADRLVTFPNWAIRQLKTDLEIDTLDIKDLDVNYSEHKEESGKTGTVKFMHTSGRFFNISNKKELLAKNPLCRVNLNTRFMGEAKLELGFTFNLVDKAYSYSYKGHLGPINLVDVNSAVMPLGMVKITSGQLKSLDFNINSTQKISKGKVTFLYNNLKVDVLKRDDEKGYSKKGLISLLANTFILKKDNPDNGKALPRIADVAFIRPANFPFFKTVWFTLLSGLKAGVGVGKADEKQPGQPITPKEQKEQDKAMKKAKKNKDKEDKKFREKVQGKAN
ncbi:hypothetical protein [Mucilaginibacter flavus]|uniref:hypothetical protein n=1 Tax=Mucilaginibacter flavus TaxID=931504 RepID=UPI0025B4CA0E|nr:hypothetical protein [Mucilaginibacter flavus]MDN3582895.1 hypothetical protein [Mucilaginibacter flavus]